MSPLDSSALTMIGDVQASNILVAPMEKMSGESMLERLKSKQSASTTGDEKPEMAPGDSVAD